ncbi:hypothetical protein ES705_48802 [subsurface metagenome]
MELFSVGDTDTIDSVTATYEFRGYEDPIDLGDCLFLTSDSKVATVKEVNGVVTVTAVKVGTADILVSYKDEAKAVATDTVAVTVSAVLLTSIVVSPDEITIPGGEPTGNIGTIIACYNDGSVDGIDLDDEGCDYQSSDEDVATVKDGVITKVAKGWTIITVSYTEGGITGKDIVLVLVDPSNATEITDFVLVFDNAITISYGDGTIAVDVPLATPSTALEALVATFDLSPGATAIPASGATADFSAPVIYTVTAEDEITEEVWTVEVTAQ